MAVSAIVRVRCTRCGFIARSSRDDAETTIRFHKGVCAKRERPVVPAVQPSRRVWCSVCRDEAVLIDGVPTCLLGHVFGEGAG